MIVVTAPTGLIGHQVLQNLLDSGEPVRIIVRDPSRLPAQARERAEIIHGSHGASPSPTGRSRALTPYSGWCPPTPTPCSAEAAYVNFTRPACDAFKRHQVRR